MNTTLIALVVSFVVLLPHAVAQVRSTRAGSAEARSRIAEQRAFMAAQRGAKGILNVANLKVGVKGQPVWIDAKVMQVIDGNTMLVGIEDSRTGTGQYRTWVMVKCPTAGIVDGKFWRGGSWKKVTGSAVLEVTGTKTYRTVLGATKTVFVIEPVKEVVKPGDDRKKPAEGPAARFVGRWTIVDTRGRVACYFTLTDSFKATKSHAPDTPGTWRLVGDEARITWGDGWKDVLRPEKGGTLKIAFRPKTSWEDKPTNTQRAIKEPRK